MFRCHCTLQFLESERVQISSAMANRFSSVESRCFCCPALQFVTRLTDDPLLENCAHFHKFFLGSVLRVGHFSLGIVSDAINKL